MKESELKTVIIAVLTYCEANDFALKAVHDYNDLSGIRRRISVILTEIHAHICQTHTRTYQTKTQQFVVLSQAQRTLSHQTTVNVIHAHCSHSPIQTAYDFSGLIACILFFICPIAIAYSYGTDNKIGLRLSVCLSVCHHSHGRISLSIFTKFDTEV